MCNEYFVVCGNKKTFMWILTCYFCVNPIREPLAHKHTFTQSDADYDWTLYRILYHPPPTIYIHTSKHKTYIAPSMFLHYVFFCLLYMLYIPINVTFKPTNSFYMPLMIYPRWNVCLILCIYRLSLIYMTIYNWGWTHESLTQNNIVQNAMMLNDYERSSGDSAFDFTWTFLKKRVLNPVVFMLLFYFLFHVVILFTLFVIYNGNDISRHLDPSINTPTHTKHSHILYPPNLDVYGGILGFLANLLSTKTQTKNNFPQNIYITIHGTYIHTHTHSYTQRNT